MAHINPFSPEMKGLIDKAEALPEKRTLQALGTTLEDMRGMKKPILQRNRSSYGYDF